MTKPATPNICKQKASIMRGIARKTYNYSNPTLQETFTFLAQETTKRPGSQGFEKSAEIGHGPSAPSLIAPKHCKTNVLGAFVPLKRTPNICCKHPNQLQESLAQSVPGVPPKASIPENGVVRGNVPRGVSGALLALQKVSRGYLQSVPDTFLTLQGHSRDTFWTLRSPGPEAPRRHPVGHSLGHPRFSGTLSGTLFGTLRPERLL